MTAWNTVKLCVTLSNRHFWFPAVVKSNEQSSDRASWLPAKKKFTLGRRVLWKFPKWLGKNYNWLHGFIIFLRTYIIFFLSSYWHYEHRKFHGPIVVLDLDKQNVKCKLMVHKGYHNIKCLSWNFLVTNLRWHNLGRWKPVSYTHLTLPTKA